MSESGQVNLNSIHKKADIMEVESTKKQLQDVAFKFEKSLAAWAIRRIEYCMGSVPWSRTPSQ